MSRRRPMSDLPAFRNTFGRVPPGYGERHVRTAWFGTGEARLPSLVSKDRSYKPVVKASGGKRESDGAIVLLIAASNAAGGKDPDFGHAGNGGKREDMTETARSNHLDGYPPVDNVRQLESRLWATAKQSSLPRASMSLTPGVVTSHLAAVATAEETAA